MESRSKSRQIGTTAAIVEGTMITRTSCGQRRDFSVLGLDESFCTKKAFAGKVQFQLLVPKQFESRGASMLSTLSPSRRRCSRRGNADMPLVFLGLIGGMLGGVFLIKLMEAAPESETADVETTEATTDRPESEAASEVQTAADAVEVEEEPQLTPEQLAERRALAKETREKALRTRAELMKLQESVASDFEDERRGPNSRFQPPWTRDRDDHERDVPRSPVPANDSPRAPNTADTIDYWNALNDAIDNEAAERGNPGTGFTEGSAAGFLARRVSSGQNAAIAIRSLSTNGVDVQAVQLGKQLAKWYEDNAEVASQGMQVMSSDSKSRQGQAGKDWKSAERKLQSDVAQINRSATSLQRTLGRRYRTRFPDLH